MAFAAKPAWTQTQNASASGIDQGLRKYMLGVYNLMGISMGITALFSWGIAQSPEAMALIFGSPLKWLVMLAPLGVVFFLSAKVHSMNPGTARMVLFGFAALMGISISYIFVVYTGLSIVSTFLATSVGFLGLSLYGYSTKRDLSGIGRFLVMGLIGLIVAMLINLFLQSPALGFAVSCIGVLIFAGLTAYDTQRIRKQYQEMRYTGAGAAALERTAVHGALTLYLDFVNLFLFLLQFMGNRQ